MKYTGVVIVMYIKTKVYTSCTTIVHASKILVVLVGRIAEVASSKSTVHTPSVLCLLGGGGLSNSGKKLLPPLLQMTP